MRLASFGLALLTVVGSSAVAHAQATQFRADFSFPFEDTCNGEVVLNLGEVHFVFSGDKVILNANGTAMGLDSGTLYQWNDTIHTESEVIVDGNVTMFLTSGMQKLRLISRGNSLNLVLTVAIDSAFVVTFDPDTGVPIDFEFIDNTVEVLDCRGAE